MNFKRTHRCAGWAGLYTGFISPTILPDLPIRSRRLTARINNTHETLANQPATQQVNVRTPSVALFDVGLIWPCLKQPIKQPNIMHLK